MEEQLGIPLSNLVSIYQTECANRSNLWAVYVVATFAAGGFVVTAKDDVGTFAKIALSLGFLAFAIGHGFLLFHNTSALIALETLLKSHDPGNSSPFLGSFVGNTGRILPFIPHIIIDICVISVIWSHKRLAHK
jgi:hypothetical protein